MKGVLYSSEVREFIVANDFHDDFRLTISIIREVFNNTRIKFTVESDPECPESEWLGIDIVIYHPSVGTTYEQYKKFIKLYSAKVNVAKQGYMRLGLTFRSKLEDD